MKLAAGAVAGQPVYLRTVVYAVLHVVDAHRGLPRKANGRRRSPPPSMLSATAYQVTLGLTRHHLSGHKQKGASFLIPHTALTPAAFVAIRGDATARQQPPEVAQNHVPDP